MQWPAGRRPDAGQRGAYRAALAMLHTGHGDPIATIDRALAVDPGFVSGLCLRAAALVMACRRADRPALAQTLAAARRARGRADDRERRHLDAAQAWLDGDLRRSLEGYGAIAAAHPHDTLALRVAHQGDLQWGRVRQLRDRVAAVLPHWHEGLDGHAHVLAMYAFGLAENGDHALAERVGRRALALDCNNAGAVHAVAHALEMQGRADDGVAWLHRTASDWTRSGGYAPHLWWHLALFHLERGEVQVALRIHDRQLRRRVAPVIATLVDASALLWRLQLMEVDVSDRWPALAQDWLRSPVGGLRPFTDTHAMLAFVGAGHDGGAQRLLESFRTTATGSSDLDTLIRGAALPVCQALMAFCGGDYASASSILYALRHLSRQCGGSHAQCDLLHLTLVESALRAGHLPMARALVDERLAARPRSAVNRRLLARLERCRPARPAAQPLFEEPSL
jgi:hypothetical protein